MPHFAFANSPLNRNAHIRSKAEELEKRRKSPSARFIGLAGDQLRMVDQTLDTSPPKNLSEALYLGEDSAAQNWFAAAIPASDSYPSLRSVMVEGLVPAEQLSIIAQARSLLHWHDSHKFCARCGTASEMKDAGYRRHCAVCQADHFPRTDPVVIMAVTCGKKTLLGRQKSWPEGMYSTLAGFMEPGETIEDAVRREVFEEVGVTVGRVDYVTCQPWPFPASLMIGMIGETTDEALNIDESEIETARWFEADELRMMLKRKHPQGLTASRPDAIAWHLATKALERIG